MRFKERVTKRTTNMNTIKKIKSQFPRPLDGGVLLLLLFLLLTIDTLFQPVQQLY